jgi:hypothetical protein
MDHEEREREREGRKKERKKKNKKRQKAKKTTSAWSDQVKRQYIQRTNDLGLCSSSIKI